VVVSTGYLFGDKLLQLKLIGWTCFGVGVISFTILGSLDLFQRAERKRWQNQNNEVLIDVTPSLSD
jgi:hypothetical protein